MWHARISTSTNKQKLHYANDPHKIQTILKTSLHEIKNKKILPVKNMANAVIHCLVRPVSSSIFKQIFDCGHRKNENQRYHGDVLPECVNFWDQI